MADRQPYVIGTLAGLSLGLLALLLFWVSPWNPEARPSAPADPAPATVSTPDPLGQARDDALVQAIRRVSPSVVSINVFRTQQVTPITAFEDALERFFSINLERNRGNQRSKVGFGSGFIVRHDGQILTSYHVVGGGEEIVVTLSTGENFYADLVGASAEYDLALLQIRGEVSGLPVVRLGDSDHLEIGEWAIAIGSPYGYLLADTSPTATVGVISAINRDIKRQDERQPAYFGMIQTDAAINPGNSGGPLVDRYGRVVGINTFVFSSSGESVGIGFAVPINRGKWVLEEIRTYGRIRRTYAGMDGRFLTAYARRALSIGAEYPPGFLVEDVTPGSAADQAGIQPLDVIVAVDGEQIPDEASLRRRLYESRVGTVLALELWRGGQTLTRDVVLQEMPTSGP